MRNWVIWCVVILAIAGTACSKGPKPSEQGKARQEDGTGGKTEGPPKELTVDLGGGVKMEFVLIPAGSFMMGDEKGLDSREAGSQGDHHQALLPRQVRGHAGAMAGGDGQQSEPVQGAEEPGRAGELG